jgi:uncharacterized membrane protein YkoI
MTQNGRCMKVGSLALALAMILAWQSLAAADRDASQRPGDTCSIKVPEPEPKDLSSLANIKANSALAAVLATNPGTTATKVELENENGCLVYSIRLNNGLDVKVDAGKGVVLKTQPADSDERESDHKGRESED